MKKHFCLVALGLLILIISLNSCNDEVDQTPPSIYIIGQDEQIVGNHNSPYDTIVLLYTKYIEPQKTFHDIVFKGAYAEDNISPIEKIVLESDIDDLMTTSEGYLRRAGDNSITYTAIDEAGNAREAIRNLSIRNISKAFAGVYETSRSSSQLDNSTVYNSSLSPDIAVPGRIRFPRVYQHNDDNNNSIYFTVNADLWSPDKSTNASELIRFMGKSNEENEVPFFINMSYEEAIESAYTFTKLHIAAQEFSENYITIIGANHTDDVNTPKSKIEYIGESKTIQKITLHLIVTYDDGETQWSDEVIETYIPQ